jgi:hypothetical protein
MSWYQLLGIQREVADAALYEKRRVPSACPNDGEPLTPGPDNVLFCRFDGWRWKPGVGQGK